MNRNDPGLRNLQDWISLIRNFLRSGSRDERHFNYIINLYIYTDRDKLLREVFEKNMDKTIRSEPALLSYVELIKEDPLKLEKLIKKLIEEDDQSGNLNKVFERRRKLTPEMSLNFLDEALSLVSSRKIFEEVGFYIYEIEGKFIKDKKAYESSAFRAAQNTDLDTIVYAQKLVKEWKISPKAFLWSEKESWRLPENSSVFRYALESKETKEELPEVCLELFKSLFSRDYAPEVPRMSFEILAQQPFNLPRDRETFFNFYRLKSEILSRVLDLYLKENIWGETLFVLVLEGILTNKYSADTILCLEILGDLGDFKVPALSADIWSEFMDHIAGGLQGDWDITRAVMRAFLKVFEDQIKDKPLERAMTMKRQDRGSVYNRYDDLIHNAQDRRFEKKSR